ncbi:MAG: hypothetical protein QM784_21935 [Polyangiaceae bacterium]
MRRTNKICLRDAPKRVIFCLGFFVLSVNAFGCSNNADDCNRTLTCKPEGGADAGGASSGGTSSTGGTAKGGSSTSSGGTTATTTAPCDGKCSGATPVCEVNTQEMRRVRSERRLQGCGKARLLRHECLRRVQRFW